MSKTEYALFALLSSAQAGCNALAEGAIGLGFQSIGGRVWSDNTRFRQLINTAIAIRHRFAIAAFIAFTPISFWLLIRNGASIQYSLALCGLLVLTVAPLLTASVLTSALRLQGSYRKLQSLNLISSALRLALITIYALTTINALIAASAATIVNLYQALSLKRWTGTTTANHPINKRDEKEILRLSYLSFPNTIFFCLQGQITFLILTVMGNVEDIADVAALGRLALIFAVLSSTFSHVIAPRFSRCQTATAQRKLYILLSATTLGLVTLLALVSSMLPGPMLAILGGQYSHLEEELALVIGAGCISQIGGVLWSLNSSKAWIRVQSIGFIPAILASQIASAFILDLKQLHDVLLFNLITAAVPIPLYIADAVTGLRTTAKKNLLHPESIYQ